MFTQNPPVNDNTSFHSRSDSEKFSYTKFILLLLKSYFLTKGSFAITISKIFFLNPIEFEL